MINLTNKQAKLMDDTLKGGNITDVKRVWSTLKELAKSPKKEYNQNKQKGGDT